MGQPLLLQPLGTLRQTPLLLLLPRAVPPQLLLVRFVSSLLSTHRLHHRLRRLWEGAMGVSFAPRLLLRWGLGTLFFVVVERRRSPLGH